MSKKSKKYKTSDDACVNSFSQFNLSLHNSSFFVAKKILKASKFTPLVRVYQLYKEDCGFSTIDVKHCVFFGVSMFSTKDTVTLFFVPSTKNYLLFSSCLKELGK